MHCILLVSYIIRCVQGDTASEPAHRNVLAEDPGMPEKNLHGHKAALSSYNQFKTRLIDYYNRNLNNTPVSMSAGLEALKSLISGLELQDQKYIDPEEAYADCCENLEKSLSGLISEIYSDDAETMLKVQSKIPEFVTQVCELLEDVFFNLIYNPIYYDLSFDLQLIASYHVEKGSITASGPRDFVLKIFYSFINESLEFYKHMSLEHPELMKGSPEAIKEDFKEAIAGLPSDSDPNDYKAAISFAKSSKALIESVLILCDAENIAFGGGSEFSRKERKSAFEVVIRSKAVIGFISVLASCIDTSSEAELNVSDFDDLTIGLANYFFDYDKISILG